MTENEAINALNFLVGYEDAVDKGKIDAPNNINSQEKEALKFILDEIQKYRELGTVEEILKVLNNQRTVVVTQHETLKQYRAIGTIEEFKALKEADMRGANRAVDEFANYLHKIAKENNGLRLSSETKSWTHPCIFDYLEEFKDEQICKEET